MITPFIDWSQPIETTDGKPCEVVKLDQGHAEMPAQVYFPEHDMLLWLRADGTWKGLRNYAVRNVVTAA